MMESTESDSPQASPDKRARRDAVAEQARCILTLNPNSRSAAAAEGDLTRMLGLSGFQILGGGSVSGDRLEELLRAEAYRLRPNTDRILVCGGDGTINRSLPILLEAPVPFALIPLGTANDLARSLGVPTDLEGAVDTARWGRVARIDMARVNDKPFVNVASMGVGPKVTERLSGELKKRLGIFGYPRALLSAYRDARPFRCRIRVDDGAARRLRAIHLAVGNGRCYGGGAVVDEHAAVDSGYLDLYALSPVSPWRLLWLGLWIRSGRHDQVDQVQTVRGTKLDIRASRRLAISADGEILTRTPAHFEIFPGALAVMVPRDSPGEGLQGSGRIA